MKHPLQRFDAPAQFSLDRRDHARRRTMQRREWRLLLILPLLVVILGVLIQTLLRLREALPVGPGEPVLAEVTLEPSPAPRLSDAPALPPAADIAATLPLVQDLMASHATIRHDLTLDAGTLAWAQLFLRDDRAVPPLPTFANAQDLLLGHLPEGSAVTTEGRLLDARVDGAWMILVLGLGEDHYAVLLTDAEQRVVVGRPIRVAGRMLGQVTLPSGTSGATTYPLLTGTTITTRAQERDDDDLAPFRTAFPRDIPADLYAGVSDERNVLERTPYYTLLGLAKADRSTEGDDPTLEPGNTAADRIHRDPEAFRGQRFHVTGHVYRAWEDPLVARDKPYGIERVVRVLLWNRDIGQITEIEDGKPHFKTQILRLYELCLVTDQPLPQRGDQLVAAVRFFKFRAIPVHRDRLRDEANGVTRQSDRVYPFTFVGGPYTVVAPPPTYELSWTASAGLALCLALILFLLWVVRRDARLQQRVAGQIRSLRATRRSLTKPPCSPPPSS